MPDFKARLKNLVLPSWMSEGEPAALLRASRTFWQGVYEWVSWPLRQFDPLMCAEPLLKLLAYDRDITRFNGEPLTLFRKRVAYAFINASDAGSAAGFIAIFDRLGIGYVELLERQEGVDWDVIMVRVTDSQIADNSDLLLEIIRKYGRTCRRYQFEVITTSGLNIRAGWNQGEYVCYPATLGTESTPATFGATLS